MATPLRERIQELLIKAQASGREFNAIVVDAELWDEDPIDFVTCGFRAVVDDEALTELRQIMVLRLEMGEDKVYLAQIHDFEYDEVHMEEYDEEFGGEDDGFGFDFGNLGKR